MADINKKRVDDIAGKLGSDIDNEVVIAGRFLMKMARERKMNMVEFLTAAYGGGSERIVYKEKTVYRDRPEPTGTAKPQSRPYGDDGFAEAYRRAEKRFTDDPPPHGTSDERRAAEEMRRQREANDDMRARTYKNGSSKAYGSEGSMSGKIRSALSYHTMAFTLKEKEFLESLAIKLDNGYEMTPKQRAWYADIMKKVGL